MAQIKRQKATLFQAARSSLTVMDIALDRLQITIRTLVFVRQKEYCRDFVVRKSVSSVG